MFTAVAGAHHPRFTSSLVWTEDFDGRTGSAPARSCIEELFDVRYSAVELGLAFDRIVSTKCPTAPTSAR